MAKGRKRLVRVEQRWHGFEPPYLGLAALTAFALFGVAAVLSSMGRSLWHGNGTNQAHAYSILTALPFTFFWNKTMRENWRRLGQGEPNEGGRPWLRTAALGAGARPGRSWRLW